MTLWMRLSTQRAGDCLDGVIRLSMPEAPWQVAELLHLETVSIRILADTSRLTLLPSRAKATGRTPANVSKYLKTLANGGLLARRKEGLQLFYRLVDPVWEQVCRLVNTSIL